MKIVYYGLALVALLLLLSGFGFFSSPASSVIDGNALDQWYVQSTVVGAIIGALAGVGFGWLAPRLLHAGRGEAAEGLHRRVVLFGILAIVVGLVIAATVTLGTAYTRSDWQLSPSERLGLVVGAGRFFSVIGAAWLTAAIAYIVLVRTRAWNGRGAF
jgi:hypothetical protein